MSLDLKVEAELVAGVACEAGKLLMTYFGRRLKSQTKKDATPVTEADLASNELICQMIASERPDHLILSEEAGGSVGAAGQGKQLAQMITSKDELLKIRAEVPSKKQNEGRLLWVVDPLDGTANFMHGLPYFSVSIGLVEIFFDQREVLQLRPLIGAVFHPATSQVYSAWQGGGAFLSSAKIQSSEHGTLEGAFVSCGYHGSLANKGYENAYIDISRTVDSSRRMGSAALDLANTAAGVFDAFFDAALQPWDMAAAAVILKEAGAEIGNFPGLGCREEFDLLERGIVAGSSGLVKEINRKFDV